MTELQHALVLVTALASAGAFVAALRIYLPDLIRRRSLKRIKNYDELKAAIPGMVEETVSRTVRMWRYKKRERELKYGFVIRWHEPDDGFICTVPVFPGLSAYGSTPDSALKEAYVALDLFIEEYEADGVPLPAADQG